MQAQAKQDGGIAWKTGVWKHVPWLAFASLFGFTVCCGALGAILVTSDGRDVKAWPHPARTVPVSVLLSLVVSLANLCLGIALQAGYEISWWNQAMKGAELRKLQFDMDIQKRISSVFGKNFTLDKFLIAAVVSLAVSLLDGPLIQRASTVTIKEFAAPSIGVGVGVSSARLPTNFSTTGDGFQGSYLFTPLFSGISRAYANRDDLLLPVEGCETNTTCVLTLPAPGFDVSCTEKPLPYDIGQLAGAGDGNQITNPSLSGPFKEVTAFNISITATDMDLLDPTRINITVMYKPEATLAGSLIQRQCLLRLATVGYPITVTDGVATLKSWELGQNETMELVHSPYDPLFIYSMGSADNKQTMLGGFFYLLEALYTSHAVLQQAGKSTVPYIINATGQPASNYLSSDVSTYHNYTMTWADPTADIVNTARELMLRSAIAYSDSNRAQVKPQVVMAQRTQISSAYKSEYVFLAATLACMVLQALIVASLLFGWHRLGRPVTLNTFEVARALGAPLLQGGSSNSPIQEGLVPLQDCKLRYGEIIAGTDHVQTIHDDPKVASPEGVRSVASEEDGYPDEERPRLALGPEENTRDIRPAVLY